MTNDDLAALATAATLIRTCGACASFKRCEAFGVAKTGNTECDWEPSRFEWSTSHVVALQAEVERLKSEFERMTLAYQAEHDLHVSNVDNLTADYHELGEAYQKLEAENAELKRLAQSLNVKIMQTIKAEPLIYIDSAEKE